MGRFPEYYGLLNEALNDKVAYHRRLIQLDIDRTGPELTPEIKQLMMRVLLSFAKRNTEIAYCQGMNFICYFLIEMSFEEEEIFWILCYIFEIIMPQGYYVNMTPVITDIEILSVMVSHKLPKIHKSIEEKGFYLNLLLTSYFVTIFTNLKNSEVG
jgi:hypothetical protein